MFINQYCCYNYSIIILSINSFIAKHFFILFEYWTCEMFRNKRIDWLIDWQYNYSEIMDDLFAEVLKQLLLNEVRSITDFQPILIHELNVCNLPNFPELMTCKRVKHNSWGEWRKLKQDTEDEDGNMQSGWLWRIVTAERGLTMFLKIFWYSILDEQIFQFTFTPFYVNIQPLSTANFHKTLPYFPLRE